MRNNIDYSRASGRLPFWTWILPFFICFLGTQLALLFRIVPELALWYLSVPLAIALVQWWGPRILVGFYLSVVANALLLTLQPAGPVVLFAVPQTISVFCSWLFFRYLFNGKCWLPDASNTIGWFLLGVTVPLCIGLTSLTFSQTSFDVLFSKPFLWRIWDKWVTDAFWTLVICSPLLIFSTPFLEEHGWSQTRDAWRPVWIPTQRQQGTVKVELTLIFLGIVILSATMPFQKYWYLYGAFSLWGALRYGIAIATLTNTLFVLLALVIPISIIDSPHVVHTFEAGFVMVDPGMTLLYFISLITGRSYSDVMAEIRERVSAERALREEKAFTDAALDAQQDIFLVFEPITGIPIRWNAAFREVSGVSDEEIGQTRIPDDWIDPAQLDSAKASIQELLTLRKGTLELTFLSKNGVRIPTEYVASLMNHQSVQTECVIAVGRNISERKKIEAERKELEEQLRQALKMEAVGTLAGGIANDFNNILSTIIGFSELIYDELKDTPHLRSHMEHVLSAGERAKVLVRQILAFSRQSEGSCTPLSPAATLRETLKLLQSTTPENIVFETQIHDDISVILADPTQFHQIVTNLHSNACDAMEDAGGTLCTSLAKVVLSADDLKNEPDVAPGGFVRLTVSDTGVGIAPHIKDKVFEPYFTTKSIGRGTGLGLAIVHGIVRNSGGFIQIESEEGKGTRVHIFFPVTADTDAFAATVVIPDEASLPSGTEHILYVDDEKDNLEVSQRILGRAGYRITAINGSEDALESFRSDPKKYDLVITDQSMPKMSGLELAREIHAISPSTPILLYTGYSAQVDKLKMSDYGIHRILLKPLRMNMLAQVVREVIDQNASVKN
ncbi:MAG: response regulator [Deltaproteobacteria bacterium]|nr:response regulator [Deltaproteobacteria bacterium]